MSIILAVVASQSNPNKSYEIHKHADGLIRCTCPNFLYKRQNNKDRTCKHLASFHAGQLGGHAEAVESKSEAGQNLALHASRKAAGDRAFQLDKRVKKGDVTAAQEVLANRKGLSDRLVERASALLAAQ